MAQIVTKQADSTAAATLGTRYIFGELVERQFYVTLRANVTFSPSVELSAVTRSRSPFRAITETSRSCARGRHSRSNVYGRDNGSTIQDTVLASGTDSVPGMSVESRWPRRLGGNTLHVCQPRLPDAVVKVNAVLRWEYRPGSTLFVVWTQSRSGYVRTTLGST